MYGCCGRGWPLMTRYWVASGLLDIGHSPGTGEDIVWLSVAHTQLHGFIRVKLAGWLAGEERSGFQLTAAIPRYRAGQPLTENLSAEN